MYYLRSFEQDLLKLIHYEMVSIFLKQPIYIYIYL